MSTTISLMALAVNPNLSGTEFLEASQVVLDARLEAVETLGAKAREIEDKELRLRFISENLPRILA